MQDWRQEKKKASARVGEREGAWEGAWEVKCAGHPTNACKRGILITKKLGLHLPEKETFHPQAYRRRLLQYVGDGKRIAYMI